MLTLLLSALCCAFVPQHGGPHDFDFEFGSWTAHLTRLTAPLSGSKTWVSYDGTSVVHSLLGGRENIGELQVGGSAGRIDGLTYRLYDPNARQWDIYWANSRNPSIDTPMVGGFSNGRGVFYSHDTLNGRPIVVRFVFSDIQPTFFRFEQAFSPDGGKTWEVNWIATFRRALPSSNRNM
jgi:hypothetical protein